MNWRNLLRILPISVLAREDLVQGSWVGPPARKEKAMPAEAATMNRAARPASRLSPQGPHPTISSQGSAGPGAVGHSRTPGTGVLGWQ